MSSGAKKRVIVLEGPDGSGKSTLAEEFEKLGLHRIHSGGPCYSEGELHKRIGATRALANDPSFDNGVVIDRIEAVSNWIYRVAGGEDPGAPLGFFFAQVLTLRPVLIYCRTNDELALQGISQETKLHKPPEYMEKVRKNYGKITDLYDLFMGSLEGMGSGVTVFRYDRKFHNPTEYAKSVLKRMN